MLLKSVCGFNYSQKNVIWVPIEFSLKVNEKCEAKTKLGDKRGRKVGILIIVKNVTKITTYFSYFHTIFLCICFSINVFVFVTIEPCYSRLIF
jgi:hypothetical protein